MEINAGQVSESDLAIEETNILSIRQEALNAKPREYVPASSDAIQNTVEELRTSSIYLNTKAFLSQKNNGFLPPIELIHAIQKEIARFKNTKGIFTIGMQRKINKIQSAFNTAMSNLNQCQTVDDFLNLKINNGLSLQEALRSPRKSLFFQENTDSWSNINKVISHLSIDSDDSSLEINFH